MLKSSQILDELRARVAAEGSLRVAARSSGVDVATLSKLLSKKPENKNKWMNRQTHDKLAKYLTIGDRSSKRAKK